MKTLSVDEVLHLAHLARLTLTKEEITILRKQLSEILGHMEELSEVRTDSVIPTSQTTRLVDVLRNDQVDSTRILTTEEALSGTENVANGAFLVPQVIDKNQ